MRVLLTGVNGFVGSHLVDYIQKMDNHIEIFGICRWRSNKENFEDAKQDFTLIDADLLDLGSIIRALESIKPDLIFHLAAQSYVVSSFNYPAQTITTNIIGTLNLLEAIRILKQDPIVHVCGSSEVYGMVDKKYVPIREDCPFGPSSPYAVGKVGEDMVALQYFNTYGIKTIRTRAFSHTGPRRGEVFAASAFAKQLAAIKVGLQKNVVYVGNLESVRTFSDVRDTVRAYWLAATRGVAGEVYNVGGIKTVKIGDVLSILMGISEIKPEIIIDAKLMRPSDVTLQIPCVEKFTNQTGWTPEIPLDKTLEDLFYYWKHQLIKNPWKYKGVIDNI
jgi:GDP-mannose 4,6-dehydratase